MKIQIKSVLEQISETVFVMKNLAEAKKFIIDFVEAKAINEVDKKLILNAVTASTSMYKLQNYLVNALLKYEGLGTNFNANPNSSK